jgi:hypothetical protein
VATVFLFAKENTVEAAYLSAIAALAGSAVGGFTSFLSSWLSQSAQLKARLFLHDKGRRQELYREFADEASKSYIEAVTSDTPDLSRTMAVYALINRMRVLSSPKVIQEAERVAQLIVDSYSKENKTFDDLRILMDEHSLDPLKEFSECCREELRGPPPP